MARTENHLLCIDEYLLNSTMNNNDKDAFREIAKYASELDYTPKHGKNARGEIMYLCFIKSKVSRTLMKFRIWGPWDDIAFYTKDNEGKVQLILSFFTTPEYSKIFHQGIKRVIEEFDGKYTGCYGCGKCKGKLQGYTYIYPDGKKVFRCGGELIELPFVGSEYADEIKKMIKTQDNFWMEQIADK